MRSRVSQSLWLFSTTRGGGYGYLGVDIFLVFSGYFFLKSLLTKLEEGKFNYWSFIFRKIVRLWPLILIAGGISLLVGYFLMLPDDYENLAESVIASSVFANNILSCITTKNYWNVSNIYKPLMHTWYVGVLMQAYIVIPLVYLFVTRITKEVRKSFLFTTIVLTAISLGLYLVPSFSTAWKFYYLPFRLFEITVGGLLIFVKPLKSNKWKKILLCCSLVIILLMLTSQIEILSSSFMLLTVVLESFAFVWCSNEIEFSERTEKCLSCFAILGKSSYSIYIWHQVIIAFLLYSVFSDRNALFFVVLLFLTAVFSFLSYNYIEKPLGRLIGSKKKEAYVILIGIVFAFVICVLSFIVYMNAGVTRDIPELDIETSNVHRHMHAEYCDRPYAWNSKFRDDDNTHILVLGNSFGRDWANVLYEYDSSLDITYLYYREEDISVYQNWIEEADFIFYVEGPDYKGVSELLLSAVPSEKLYIVGNKSYGESNGIIYAKRGSDYYHNLSVKLPDELIEQNIMEKERYGAHYIDLISPVQNADGKVRVFTDDNRYISQDCTHLTQAGAQYYARILDFSFLSIK